MARDETIEWIEQGLQNNRYRDFLGPLHRYKAPHDLLTDLKAGSLHIRDTPQGRLEDSKDNKKGKDGDPGKIQCYACKETGHTRRDCPKTRAGKCFKCGVAGHFARDCGKNQTTVSEVSSSDSNTNAGQKKTVNTFGNTHEKYFKDAYLDGHSLACYVDLGSSVIAIRERDAEKLNFQFERENVEQLVGYGNGTVKPVGTF